MEAIELKKNIIEEINNLPIIFLQDVSDFLKNIQKNKIKNDHLKFYMKSQQFIENKKILEQTYQDVIDGKAKLLSHDEVWEKIDSYTKSREYEN